MKSTIKIWSGQIVGPGMHYSLTYYLKTLFEKYIRFFCALAPKYVKYLYSLSALHSGFPFQHTPSLIIFNCSNRRRFTKVPLIILLEEWTNFINVFAKLNYKICHVLAGRRFEPALFFNAISTNPGNLRAFIVLILIIRTLCWHSYYKSANEN